jgi:DNA-binding transcriptional LysR family regulator
MMKTPASADMDLLSLNQLRLFDLLYTTASVTRSAEKLEQSQPAISIWLARMRRQLKDPLFVRTPKGMQPTPRAEAAIGHVRDVLRSLREISLAQAPFDPATATRAFRICMNDAAHMTTMPTLLNHLRVVAPRVSLRAVRVGPDTAQALESGEADVAYGYIPWLETGIIQQTLYKQDWVCLANRAHPRIGGILTRAHYRDEPHVSIVGGTGHELLEAGLRRQKIRRTIVVELPGFLGLGPVVSSTDLIATLPRGIGETLGYHYSLSVFTCPVPLPTFEAKLHWHVRYHQDTGIQWLRAVLTQLFKGRSPASHGPRSRAQRS